MVQPLDPWWGEVSLDPGQPVRWRIGPLTLAAERRAADWRIGSAQGQQPMDGTLEIAVPHPAADDPELEWQRFAFASAPAQIRLMPRLCDRPVVVLPIEPLTLPAGEQLTIQTSTPVWVALDVGPNHQRLVELPSWRQSDTWFGNPADGELCYASRTRGARELGSISILPHRAVTPVTVHNHTVEPLRIVRLSLPVPQLTLFANTHGRLVTDPVTVIHSDLDEPARVKLPDKAARDRQPDRVRLAEPRVPMGHNFVTRVFSDLFGG